MIILYVSALVGGKYSGPTTSVPNQIFFQSQYDQVFWYNLTDIKCPMEKCDDLYHSIHEYPSAKINDLPAPFSKPDLVVFEEFHKVQFIKFAKQLKQQKIPYVIVPRSQLTSQYMKNKRLKKILGNFFLFNSFLRAARAIQYLSKAEKIDSQNYDFKVNSFVIPNGILADYQKEANKKQNKSVTGVFIGRYNIYQKGLDILIDAVSKVKTELLANNIVINLYGPDERTGNKSDVRKLVEDAGVSDVIKVCSSVYDEEKKAVLKKADFFIHTSRYEGMSMSVLEALAYGLPCLLTNGTNMTEEIVSYEAGWNAGNDVKGVIDALKKMITDIDDLDHLSNNALKLADTYKWEAISKSTRNIYKKIIERVKNQW